MTDMINDIKSVTRKKSQNRALKSIFVSIIIIFIIGNSWSGIIVVNAESGPNPIWYSGDVQEIITLMAKNKDPNGGWLFPSGSEDEIIAEELSGIMKDIQDYRESLPYSLTEFLNWGGLTGDLLDSGSSTVGSLDDVQFQDNIIAGLNEGGLIDITTDDDILDMRRIFSEIGGEISDELIKPNPNVRDLGSSTAQLTVNNLDLVSIIGEVFGFVLFAGDVWVIFDSHFAVRDFGYDLLTNAQYSSIADTIVNYEVGPKISVEFVKLIFDITTLALKEAIDWALISSLAIAGAAAGTLVGGPIGTAVGAIAGAVFGTLLLNMAIDAILDETYNTLTELDILPQAGILRFERYWIEMNVKIEVVDIWSSGDDNIVSTGELLYVKVKNTGIVSGDFLISPFANDWTIFAVPDTPLEIYSFFINPLGVLTGALQDNCRSISLDPGEEATVWFAITPYGLPLTWNIPPLTKYSFDDIGAAAWYVSSEFTFLIFGLTMGKILKDWKVETFTSFSSGSAFNIDVNSDEKIYSPGETTEVKITVENIGSETGTFTLGVSFKSVYTGTIYDGAIIDPPDEITLAPAQIITFHASRSFPMDAPRGQYHIAVNCWKEAFYELYPDNLIWEHIFTISQPIIGSYLSIVEHSPAELDLYDPAGRHVGNYEEYDGAIYNYDPILDTRTIEVNDLIEGPYKIVLTGLEADSYELYIDVTQFGNPIYQKTYTYFINVDEVHELSIMISVSDLGQLSASSTAPEIPFEPLPPTANVGEDIITEEGAITPFDGTQSSAPMGRIVKYEWDFNEDGIFDATGPYPSFIWYDNTIVTVTLQVTSEIEVSSVGDDGEVVIEIMTLTDTDTQTVTILNLDPTSSIDVGYMDVDFTLRFAGEKWHNIYWNLYETDELGENDQQRDGQTVVEGELIAHLECVRYPGDPDSQSDTVYDVTLYADKIYYSITTYNPYQDDMPINGQPHGSNPTWIDMTFEDGSTERIHHNFNEVQSIVRESDHWVHKHPWALDYSPWLVGHTWTFKGSTTDQGSSDETFTWNWRDSTPHDVAFYPFRGPGSSTDPFPSPYDPHEGAYPVSITDTQYHAYNWEDDFVPELTLEDDDFPADGGMENDGTSMDDFDVDAIHTRVITLPDGTVLARK